MRNVLVSLGAAFGGLLVGNLLFPPEPGQAALDALPFTLVGAFVVIWPAHSRLVLRTVHPAIRWAALIVVGALVGGIVLGAILTLAGVSSAKVLSLALIGASYGGLTALFWAVLNWVVARIWR